VESHSAKIIFDPDGVESPTANNGSGQAKIISQQSLIPVLTLSPLIRENMLCKKLLGLRKVDKVSFNKKEFEVEQVA